MDYRPGSSRHAAPLEAQGCQAPTYPLRRDVLGLRAAGIQGSGDNPHGEVAVLELVGQAVYGKVVVPFLPKLFRQ